MKLKLVPIGLGLVVASAAYAAYTPIPITLSSYNQDAIVESNATPVLSVVTTATVDQGTNNGANTWFEQGYDTNNPSNGLPPAGTVVTAQDNGNYSFRMPPTYAGPNGILIDSVISNGTFTLTSPAKYTLLSFMGSGGNGGDLIGVKVNHQDGTSETGSFGCPDWFNGSGIVLTVGGRCQSPVTFTTETDGANPRIYFRDITLSNTNSPVTSIVLSYISGLSSSHNDILGVSGAQTPGGLVTPIAVTGYDYDFVVEAVAAKDGRVVSQIIQNGTNVWATTETMDNDTNTGFCFYEIGHDINMINNGPVIYGNTTVSNIAQASGIPYHGTTFTNGDHSFTMAPDYTANDVVWVSPVVPNATITLVTPTAATALSFLDAAGNGPVSVNLVIHHQDGSSENGSILVQDWFSTATPAFIPNGRVAADTAQWSQQFFAQNGADRLFQSDLPLANSSSPVTSIDLSYTNTGGRVAIFALSGTTGAVPPIITQQPTGTNLYAGTPVTLSAQTSGTAPFTYQWQKGTNGTFVNVNNGGNISGANSASLSFTPTTVADNADYRVAVSNSAGFAISGVATLVVYSTNPDVTQPGDSISAFGANLFGDGAVANAIDNSLDTKFGANITVGVPVGCVISPSVGATVVTGLRFYTANDTTGRDPADYKLEGSINGGGTWTLIASNSMTLPDGRNTTAVAPDPLNSFVTEVDFPNAIGYTTYRLTFNHFKGDPGENQVQIGEIELLGVTTNLPLNVITPTAAKAYQGTSLSIGATVIGTPPPSSRWQKQIGGVFTDLTDGGTISGSHTTTLTIHPTAFSDAGNYRIIATNTSAAVTSAVVQVTILSTLLDVTSGNDPSVTDFGNTSTTVVNPYLTVDDTFVSYTTLGSGLNNNAGFPPFSGPVGVVITPALGMTFVHGIRFYPGPDAVVQDPSDFSLDGSNDGGTTFVNIVPDSPLSIPSDRNSGPTIDPLTNAVQEILFSNTNGYTTYRVTFNHTKDDNTASRLSIGELELLGLAQRPTLTFNSSFPGQLTITSSSPSGTLQSTTNLLGANTVWTDLGPINGSTTIFISPTDPPTFFRVTVP